MKVLLTGAAGFIGGAIWQALDARGHTVVPVDAYIPQAHGQETDRDDRVHRIDLRSATNLSELLIGVDVVCHQAAMVGSGVATADLPHFASHNDLATAVLLAAMAEDRVGHLVLASSMVVYGDGLYACPRHGELVPKRRHLDDLAAGRFESRCPRCEGTMTWLTVSEDTTLRPHSSYAASKVAQEHYAVAWARQLPGRVIALRYHNVYGARMPQDTPYSGVAALFRSALERGESPRVFEDGMQMRDFVEVEDVARANVLAIEAVRSHTPDSFTAYNIASGQPVSISEVAVSLASAVSGSPPVTTGEYRAGDVRHIVASPSLATRELGFTAKIGPSEGLGAFAYAPLRAR
jgi:dTDP-L-rhamnose 4-epimerase